MARPPTSPRARLVKRLVLLAVLFSVGAGAFFGIRAYRARQQTGPRFETVKVDRGRITARVTATGTLSALVTVQVGSQVSGRIAQINVDFNSEVKKGQVIAKIDPELFRAALEQSRANFIAAKGNLAKAKAQAEDAARQAQRSTELAARELIAVADRDTAVSNAAAAKAQVEASEGSMKQAEASLHSAQVNLAYTTIVSPIDGVVISRSVDVGQTVAASLQAPTLFTIAEDLKKMQVDTNVAEADVGKLQPGMAATFTVDAYPSERFRGKVRQIRNAPQTVQNVVTYDAVIDVDNAELKLKPGMTANVTFIVSDKNDAVRLANAALRFRPPADMIPGGASSAVAAGSAGPRGNWTPGASGAPRGAGRMGGGGNHERTLDTRTVWLLRGTTPESHTVRVGVTDGSFTELTEGDVKPGDLLITGVTSDASGSPKTGLPGAGPGGPARRMF
ncbi:MAG TPA: efflux RND transporter periplasmic adaptor subunit [Polyangiaceae bacterium]|nr:efflux RND transporter periplasmic adaptor subunit [Polyangiaceae bacterium]